MTKKRIILFLLIAVIPIVIFLLFRQYKSTAKHSASSEMMLLAFQEANFHATQNGKLIPLLSEVLAKMDREIKENKRVADQSLHRLAAIGNAFYPYRHILADSLSKRPQSPERGQLLQALLHMGLDSSAFAKIKIMISFKGADLRQANLSQADLSGIDLSSADMTRADLQGVKLAKAHLEDAILYGVDLAQVDLSQIHAARADFSWSDLTAANFAGAMLDGAKFESSKLDHSNFEGVSMLIGSFENADLRHANLHRANLYAVNFKKCDLRAVDLKKGKLVFTHMEGANLIGTQFNGAIFRTIYLDEAIVENRFWLDSLSTWQVESCDYAQQTYQVQMNSSQEASCRIEKK